MKGRLKGFFSRMWAGLDSSEKKSTFILAAILEFIFLYNTIGNFATGYETIGVVDIFFMIGFAVFMFISLRKGWEKIAAFLTLMLCILLMLPMYFFIADGAKGGSVFYIAVMAVFTALCLSGVWRVISALSLAAVSVALYLVYYFRPDLIEFNSRATATTDSFVGMVAGAISLYVMVRVQKKMLQTETKKAMAETQRAEEANRSQNRFFSSMSHEIRTPINSILGLNEIIMRQEDASDEIKKDARNIQGAGRMLLSLVNDILDVSKIEAGKMEIVPVNYNVGSLISEIVNMIWLKAEEKGLKLTVDVDPALPSELFGDEIRIKQILINLLNNAVKYTQEGSVSLHMECETKDGDSILLNLSVSDTGMGISQDAMPYLFDSFKRVDETKNRKIEGTGLGLSIVRQLVVLMGGEITVDSVYGQGSTFSVTLPQKISNAARIGDINITNYTDHSSVEQYECGFSAPEARVLFIDDNEMNLEVEAKLLNETGMTIDTALSGQEGLKLTLTNKYDVIFLDHLMPEMDGIECLSEIRRQTGGLNNQVPVIVLTANAGSENRELYTRSGFDDYLMKPVSGRQLEDSLIRHLPAKKLSKLKSDKASHELNTAKGYTRKTPTIICASTMCDLPKPVLETMAVDIIPYIVHTEDGDFWDNVEAASDELVEYMNTGEHKLKSDPPSEEEYEKFFAAEVRKAHHVIYIAMTTSMSEEYAHATAAAQAFENVTVINSECLSTSLGILVMIACYLVDQNEPHEKVIEELNRIKSLIHCSFVLSQTDYMMRQAFIGKRTNLMMKSLDLHPTLRIKNDSFKVGRIWTGSVRRCFAKYIRYAIPGNVSPDWNVIFVTYVDLSDEDKEWIEQEIRQRADFEHIIFQKASAAISLNCGPGTFGLLYMEKDKRAYHLNSYLMPAEISEEDNDEELHDSFEEVAAVPEAAAVISDTDVTEHEPKWYEEIKGIDGKAAVKNSGSEDALRTVLKLFYESIDSKDSELDGFYRSKDIRNFTIKVHALKSSAKLVGALKLSEHAQAMESAGKTEDLDYIDSHYSELMEEYRQYKSILASVFDDKPSDDDAPSLPVADSALMESVYETLKEAAEAMDTSTIEDTLEEMKAYAIPDDEKERFDAIRECFENFDYDGMLAKLNN